MKRLGTFFFLLASLSLAIAAFSQETSETQARHGILLDINGAIGPATRDFVARALNDASESGAEIVILRINTPGGLDASTRDIVSSILNSPTPVATFVAPAGARAASAGTYILLASHIAAMAPATNVGAATPVSIMGGTPSPSGKDSEAKDPEPDPQENKEDGDDTVDSDVDSDEQEDTAKPPPASDAMSRKAINDSVAYIRGLASRHGRNPDWAEKAVREADSITSEAALELNVIDLIAPDTATLLAEIDGRTIEVAGSEKTLDTEGLLLQERKPDWRNELLAVITDPTIAYILLLIGFYGLVLEGYHPGAIVPGVVGAISLLLALYAFQMLPVNYAGLALIILGIILIIAETIAPSFGALGIGGVIALVIGSIILMDTDVPGFEVSRSMIGAIALTSSALLLGIVAMAVRARRRPVVAGREQLLGAHGTVIEDFEENGAVYVGGERWAAKSLEPVLEGQSVLVTAVHGLTLHIEPISKNYREEKDHV